MAFNITPQAIIQNVITGANLLTNSLAVDVNAVLNQETMKQVFADARPIKATVKETARVMDYPVETGATLSDHKILNPTEIEMSFLISEEFYSTAYQQMRNAWQNSTLLAVQTRTGTYSNMIIAEMPHEEEPDIFNAITQFVRFREVLFVVPSSVSQSGQLSNYSPRDPANASVINRGLISAITTSLSALSYFRAISIWGK